MDGDNYSLFLGKWHDGCGAQNWSWADLHLNLSGLEDKDLDFSFWFKYFHDEDQFQDGTWFSDDGGETFTPKPVISLQPDRWANLLYGKFQTFDLDELIEKHGLSFSEDFVIRFWQVGTGDWDTSGDEDGLFIDGINIEVVPPVIYKNVSFCDDFEVDSVFEKHWRYGYAELDDDGVPINGTTPSAFTGSYAWGAGNRALLVGKFNDSNGATLSKSDLHLDITNVTKVTLSFAFVDYYNEPQAEEGIWISTDGGANFYEERIYEFPDYPNNNIGFNSLDVPLSDLAAAKGIVLTNKTVLRIQQSGTGDFDTSGDEDGIVLDNVCVSGISAVVEAMPPLSLDIFPNPVQNVLHLQWKAEHASDLVVVRVFDLTGKNVGSYFFEGRGQMREVELDASTLPAAAYFLHVQTSLGQASRFFIKEK